MSNSFDRGAKSMFAPIVHATHPDWRMGTELACTQLQAFFKHGGRGRLGIFYFTSPYIPYASEILALLRTRTGITDWVGSSAYSVAAYGTEYQDEPALALMLLDLPADDFKVFSGLNRPPSLDSKTPKGHLAAYTALVHADPATPDLIELVHDMAAKTETGSVFGAISSARNQSSVQIANQTFSGGISGVMFSNNVPMLRRVTQGCRAIGDEHSVTETREHLVLELDHKPALDVMLTDFGVDEQARGSRDGETIIRSLKPDQLRSGLLAAVGPPRRQNRGIEDLAIRHVVGIDPSHRLIALAGGASQGDRLVFCSRDEHAARSDLIRICSELREEIDSLNVQVIAAHWVSCVARSGQLFGGLESELEVIQAQFGDLPLIGIYANGEIANDQIYGYTGVLTIFTTAAHNAQAD